MTLKAVHIAFIVCATALAFGGGIWALNYASAEGLGSYRIVAGLCFAAGVGLLLYGVWFLRKLKGVRYL